MLRFFRKMRNALLAENKFTRYFFYALGEIVLVVIGILIALQINNWNELRKSTIRETKLLIELKENIQTNMDLLNDQLNEVGFRIRANEIVLDVVRNKKQYFDSLACFFHNATLLFDTRLSFAAYEALKSTGFDIIESDNLRKQIIELYEVTYTGMIKSLSFPNEKYIEVLILPFMSANFERLPGTIAVPNNYENLLGNQQFINVLTHVHDIQLWTLELNKKCYRETERVLNLVRGELKKRKSNKL